MRKYSHDKTSLEYRILKNKHRLLLKNAENLDDEINRAYKLKELYKAFDGITKDEINNYDIEKELDSIINRRNDGSFSNIKKPKTGNTQFICMNKRQKNI